MNSERFPEILKNTSQLYQLSYQELKSLVLQYPYCQNLRLLLMKKSLIDEHADFERNLQLAATYSLDRTFLFKQLQHDLVFSDKEDSYNLEEEYLELKDLNSLEETLNKEPIEGVNQEEGLAVKSNSLIFNLEDIPDAGAPPYVVPPVVSKPEEEEGVDSDFLENLMKLEEEESASEKGAPQDVEESNDEIPSAVQDEGEIEDGAASKPGQNETEEYQPNIVKLEGEEMENDDIADVEMPTEESVAPNMEEPENIADLEEMEENKTESSMDGEAPSELVVEPEPKVEEGLADFEGEEIPEPVSNVESEQEYSEKDDIVLEEVPESEESIVDAENPILLDEEMAPSINQESEYEPIIEIIKSEPKSIEEKPQEAQEEDLEIENELVEESSIEIEAEKEIEAPIIEQKDIPLEITNEGAVSFDYEDQTALPEPKTSFSSWLQQFQSPQVNLRLEDLMEASRQAKERRKKLKNKQQSPKKEGKAPEVARQSIIEDKEIASETLAKILEAQELYEKAINMYKQLSLKYPEKSSFFAAKIKELKSK